MLNGGKAAFQIGYSPMIKFVGQRGTSPQAKILSPGKQKYENSPSITIPSVKYANLTE